MTVNVSGLVWAVKGYPGHRLVQLVVEPHARRVTYWNALGDGDYNTRWIWTPDRVWKETPDGSIIASRDTPRTAFEGHNFFTKWDHLHLLYFMGYAIWNYICAPFYFSWPGMKLREVENTGQDAVDSSWRALEVTYPDDIPTHNRVQIYYFDEKHSLRRLDYRAEVVGGTDAGVAAHECFDHQDCNGLLVPTLRRVVSVPDGQKNGGPSAVLLDFHDVIVKDE